ncbi:MAG: DUF4249 domain-containing protein [Bacteroidales bacterium]
MHLSKTSIFLAVAIIFFNSCIEEYTPETDSGDAELYVVEGRVSGREGFHYIQISRSSAIADPGWIPVWNCDVKISDNQGNQFMASELGNGKYRVNISADFLIPGTAFRVEVNTPTGELLLSDYDTLTSCPEIDSIYYEIEDFPASAESFIPGIQFYVDYNGENSTAGRIKYEIEETWQYEVDYPIKWTWDGRVLTIYDTPDYSKSVCWNTVANNRIFTLSTNNLNTNRFKKFPLHHVLNNSRKLLIGYSILFKQLSISEEAFTYFEKIQDNSMESGGLYETQPQQIEGNIRNASDPGSRVLGYFYAAGIKEKRIFIDRVDGLELNPATLCSPIYLQLGYGILRNLEKPVYLWLENGTYLLHEMCVDCTTWGGKTIKPGFWPN